MVVVSDNAYVCSEHLFTPSYVDKKYNARK